MVVHVSWNDNGYILYKGSFEEGCRYCRDEVDKDKWDAVDICENTGEIVKRIFIYGKKVSVDL